MTITETVLTAAALSIDACVVALALGLARRRSGAHDALVVGATFGVMSGVLPFAGAAAGALASGALARFDHWVAFAVLVALGGKSLFEARASGAAAAGPAAGPADGFLAVAAAGIAVSIDTFAAGFGFELVHGRVAALASSTGAITACGSFACHLGARRFGGGWRRAAMLVGGLALIAIAISVLREHADHL